MKQLHVLFSGRVQGVGFRQTTAYLAGGFQVTGWVKNLSDGRVELLAEGDEAELERFFTKLRNSMISLIQQAETEKRAATGKYQAFEIAYE